MVDIEMDNACFWLTYERTVMVVDDIMLCIASLFFVSDWTSLNIETCQLYCGALKFANEPQIDPELNMESAEMNMDGDQGPSPDFCLERQTFINVIVFIECIHWSLIMCGSHWFCESVTGPLSERCLLDHVTFTELMWTESLKYVSFDAYFTHRVPSRTWSQCEQCVIQYFSFNSMFIILTLRCLVLKNMYSLTNIKKNKTK